jgi:ABC-type polysaccharide/polyol phosphate export permease
VQARSGAITLGGVTRTPASLASEPVRRERAGTLAVALPEDAPSARRRLDVLAALTQSDLQARYGRGPWRLAKWLGDPFALVGVYLALVVFVLGRGGEAPGLSLACAVVPFQLLMMTVISAMGAVALRRATILNMSFERTLIPVSAVLTETVAFGASFVLLAAMMAVYGVAPTVALVWLPLVVVVTIGFAIACAYPASLFGLWFPDLRVFAISLVRTLFFLAPGLVALAEIEGRAADLVRLNPLTGLFEAYRDVLLYGQRPAAWELGVPLLAGAALLALFLPVYRREQRQFAKVVE